MTTKTQSQLPDTFAIPLEVPTSVTRFQALALLGMLDNLRFAMWKYYLWKAGHSDSADIDPDDLPF